MLQMTRINGTHFDRALKIYECYLHNLAVYFYGMDVPNAAMTLEQFRVKVPSSIYAKK